jgi:predicted metal-dependent hydrolase
VVTGEGELVVVVPKRFDRRAIPDILDAKRLWIERAQARAAARRLAAGATGTEARALPNRVTLPALGEDWEVEYRWMPDGAGCDGPGATAGAGRGDGRTAAKAVARATGEGRLIVTAPHGDEEVCRRAIIEWLRRRARGALVPRLEELGRLLGLEFAQVSVRHQRSRWASCSRTGAISLNLRLLFLDPVLVDHILVHELCHTRELNHSRRFWDLVRACDPDCALHRRQTREAWSALPWWVRADKATPRV